MGNFRQFKTVPEFQLAKLLSDITGSSNAIQIQLDGYAKTPPALSTAEVDGDELVLTYDGALDATSVPAAAAFTVTAGGAAVSVSSVSVSVSGLAVTLGLASAVAARQTVLLDYVVPSSNPLQNGLGFAAVALAGQAVENRTLSAQELARRLAERKLVSNTGQGQNEISFSNPIAQGFRTGMTPDGYVLSALELLLKTGISSLTLSNLTVTLREADSDDNPDSVVLATFMNPDSPALRGTEQRFRFTLSEGEELDMDTRYFIHLNKSGLGTIQTAATSSDNQDSGGLDDWGIDDSAKVCPPNCRDLTSSFAIKIQLDGYARTRPALSTAEVNGAELVLTYDAALDATSVPAATAFTVTVEGAAVSVSTVSVSGMAVTLGLAEAVLAQRTVLLDYVVPSSNPLQSGLGIAAGALPGQAVENRTPVPGPQGPPVPDDRILVSNTGQSTSPVLFFRTQNYGQEFRTGMSPDGYVLSALELLLRTISSATMSNLTVTLRNVSGDNPGSMVLATFVNPDSPALSDTTQTFRFTLSEGVELDPETSYFIHLANNHASGSIHTGVTASDNQDSGGLEDWGIDDRARLFSSGSWDDLIIGSARTTFVVQIRLDGYAGAEVPPPVLSTAEVNGDELVLFYGEGLDATSVPAAAAFTVTAGGAAVSVSTVSVSGLRVTLGLASVVTAGQAVRLDYAVPSSNPLQGGSGSNAGALVGQVVENRTPTSVGRSLVSNTGQTRFGLTNFRDNRNFAQGFRTGMTPDGYVLSSLELVLRTSGAAMSDLTVTLRNASGNDPDTVLATFVNPDSPALITTGRTFRFTLSEGEELDPETLYFIHLNNSADSSLGVATTESDNQDSGSLSDWGIDDMARIEGSGVWSDLTGGAAIQIWLDGFAQTPAPVLSTAEVNGDELVLSYGEALDAMSVPAAAAFTVTAGGAAVSVSSVSVSGQAVTLGLASVVRAGQTVLLDYVVPSEDPLQDRSGSDAGALAGQVVENRTPAAPPPGRPLVSNIGQFSNGSTTFGEDYAQGFRTGMNSAGYVLSALELLSSSDSSATMSNLTVTLRNASGANPGSRVLATFVNPDPPALTGTLQTFRFSLSEGVELDPDTRYFIHLNNNHPSGGIHVPITTSDNQDSSGLNDWGIDDNLRRLLTSGWATRSIGPFTYAISIRLDGYAKTPAPVLSTAEVDGDELVLTYGEALDESSVPAAAAFTVTVGGAAVSVSTVSVSRMAVTLGLAPAVTAGQTVLLDYVVPTSNPLQNGSGSDVAALAGQAVLNQTLAADLLWTSAVTIGSLDAAGEFNGYTDAALVFGSVTLAMGGGSLTDDDFEYSGSSYTVKALFAASATAYFMVDRAGLPDTLTLEMASADGTWTIAFSEKLISSTSTLWVFDDTNFASSSARDDLLESFAIGQVATVCLRSTTATNACPAARYGDPPSAPLAPSAPTVSAVSGQSDRLSVSWTAPSNGGSAIRDYDVRYCRGAATACTADAAFTGHAFTGTATATTIAMLMASSEYQVQVRAINAEGAGPWSASGAGTTAVAPVLPPTGRILVSNLGQGGSFISFRSKDYAQGFRTGMTPDGYVLSALELRMKRASSSSATMSNLTVTLRNASGDNPDSRVLATFVNPDPPALSTTGQTFRFTLPEGEELDPETRYFIHLNNNHPSDRIDIPFTRSDNQDSGGLDDWGVDDNVREFVPSGWQDVILSFVTLAVPIRLDGYAKRPPVLSTAEVNGDELVLTYGEALDESSVPAAAAFMVTAGGAAVPVSTVSVSGMAVTLGLASAVTAGQTVLLDYVVPSSNPLQNGSGTAAGALAGQAVSNQTLAADLAWTSAVTIEGLDGAGGEVNGYNSDAMFMLNMNTTLAVGGSLTDDDFEYSGSTYTVKALFATTGAVYFEVDQAGLPEVLTLELVNAVGTWTIAFSDKAVNSTSTRWIFGIAATGGNSDQRAAFEVGKVATVCLRLTTATNACPAARYGDPPLAPLAPLALSAPTVSAVSGQSDRLSVSWMAPSDGSSAITDYDVRYCRGAAAACATDADFTGHVFTGTATAATIAMLMAATEHQVQVRATNAGGTGPWSASGAGTTAAAVQVELEWTSAVTIEGLGEANGYNSDGTLAIGSTTFAVGGSLTDDDFEYSGSTYTVKALFATDRVVVFEVDPAGLPDTLTLELAQAQGTWTIAFSDKASSSTSTRWIFEDRATGEPNPHGDFEVDKVATVCLRTATQTCPAASYGDRLVAPLAPSAPTVSAVSGQSDRLSVSWMAPSDGGSAITDYDVRYCQGAVTACTTDTNFTGHAFSGTATAATIGMLMASMEHQVQVRATNAEGAGPWSASGAGTTASASDGRVLVSNTGQTQTNLIGFRARDFAQGFRTGMTPDGYVLSALELSMRSDDATMSNLTVTLRNASGGNPGSTVLATFVNPDSPALGATRQTFRFTLSESEELDPDTPYFIQLNNNHSSSAIDVPVTTSDNQDSGGLNDWGIDDSGRNQLPNLSWENIGAFVIKIRLDGYAKSPAPVLSTAEVDGDELVLTYGEALDAASVPAAAAFTVTAGGTAVSVSSVSVSGMAVTLGLASAVTAGQTVLLDYVVPSSNPLQNGSGSDTVALAGQAVLNQTLAADLVWTSAVTIEEIHATLSVNGYNTDATLSIGSTTLFSVGGSLTDDDFDYSGSTYTVKALLATSLAVEFVVDRAGLPDTLTLELASAQGTWTIAFSDKTPGVSTSTRWYFAGSAFTSGGADPNVEFAMGKVATVCLRPTAATNACPAASYTDAPPVLSAPTVSAVSGQSDRLAVSWTAPANTGSPITDYDVQYCRGSAAACTTGANFTGHAFTGTATATTIAMLMAAAEYQVQVRATNAEGTGPWSVSGSGSTETPMLTASFVGDVTNVYLVEGDEVELTVRLSGAPGRQVAIPLNARGLFGTSSSDYTGVPSSLTFGATETERSFTVTAVDDSEIDIGKSVIVEFGAPVPSGIVLPPSDAVDPATRRELLLVDNDFLYQASYQPSRVYSAGEASGALTVTVRLRTPQSVDLANLSALNETVTVSVSSTDGTATAGEDYTALSGLSLIFAPTDFVDDGSPTLRHALAEKTVTVLIADDGIHEGATPETFTLALSHDTDQRVEYVPASEGETATVSITDDDGPPMPRLVADAASVNEGDTDLEVALTVEMPGSRYAAAQVLTLDFSMGTAQESTPSMPADYSVSVRRVTIAADLMADMAAGTVTVRNDELDEDDETIVVRLLDGATVLSSATITVVDDDTRGVTVAPTALSLAEGAQGSYTVSLGSQPSASVTVMVTLSGSDSVTASASQLVFTGSNWRRAQAVTVRAAQDLDTDDESVAITHAVSGGDYAGETAADVTVAVEDNDRPSTKVTLSLSGVARFEEGGGARAVTVAGRLEGMPEAQDVTVALTAAPGTASTDDYAAVGVTLTIAAGQVEATAAFTVTPVDDRVDEEDETLMLSGTLSSAQGLAVEPAALTVTIVDDDTRGVVVAPTALTVAEEMEGIYTVSLDSQPTGAVTVALSEIDSVTAQPPVLVFTASDYGARAVTVTVPKDGDVEADAVATLSHMVNGADYGAAGVTAEPVTLTVLGHELTEDGQGVRLLAARTPPGATATVPSGTPAPAGLSLSLPFTHAGTTVTVRTAAVPGEALPGFRLGDTVADLDGVELAPDMATVCLPTSAEGTLSVQRWNTDMDEPAWVLLGPADRSTPGEVCGVTSSFSVFAVMVELEVPDLVFSPGVLAVEIGEESGASYTVALGAAPEGSVTVTVTAAAVLTVTPAALVFTVDDWAQPRTVRATALEDAEPGEAELVHTASGGRYLGEWRKTLTVQVTQDTGLLSRARQAWLARFGRTVAGQVVEAVAARLSAPAEPQVELNLGGSAPEAALLSGALQVLGGAARPDPRRTLADSSFVLPLSDGADDGWTAWGEGAYAEFDGTDGDLEIDGEVVGATVGLDREQGRWRWGLALSRSEGDGEVREAEGDRIDYESSLTGVHPYARWHGDGGLSAWGVLGWGEGELEETRDGERSETDLEMQMAALGASGPLGTCERCFGKFGLNLKSEAMAVRMEADADAAMPEVAADASRVRLRLEGVGHHPLESGGLLAQRLEVGLRWDGGDAETGLGVEVGTALRYVDPSGQLSAEFTARRLLAHEERDYEEWGVSGALRLAPDRAGRGLSLKLESGYGPTGSGLDELWRRRDLAGLAPQENVAPAGRVGAELGYGLNSLGGRGVLTPYAAYRGDDGELRLGARLDSGETLSLDVSALRRRRGEERNGIEFRVDASW